MVTVLESTIDSKCRPVPVCRVQLPRLVILATLSSVKLDHFYPRCSLVCYKMMADRYLSTVEELVLQSKAASLKLLSRCESGSDKTLYFASLRDY